MVQNVNWYQLQTSKTLLQKIWQFSYKHKTHSALLHSFPQLGKLQAILPITGNSN